MFGQHAVDGTFIIRHNDNDNIVNTSVKVVLYERL